MGENKSKEDSLRDDLNNAKNHNGCLINVIVVLTCIIIAMIAILCYKKEDFSEQISFASTITSIVLSVIAIIMTVVSGETLNNLLHKFRDLHDDIKEVPSKFEQTTDRFEKSCKDIEAVQKDLELLPSELISTRKKVEELYNELRDAHVDIKVVDSKFEDLKNGLLGAENKQEEYKTTEQVSDNLIENLCSIMPYRGLFVFYSLYIGYVTHTPFDSNLIRTIYSAEGFEIYFWGIIVTLNGLNIIEIKKVENADFEVDKMSPYMCKIIKEKLLSYYNDNRNELDENDTDLPDAFIERINKLFGYKDNN